MKKEKKIENWEKEFDEILDRVIWCEENFNPFGYGNPDRDTLRNFVYQLVNEFLNRQKQEIKEDLQTVIHMLEGSTATREQIANYIKRYLLTN